MNPMVTNFHINNYSACRGKIHGVEVSTRHFTGNYPPRCSIRGVSLPERLAAREGERMGKAAPHHEIEEIAKLNSEVVHEYCILCGCAIVFRHMNFQSSFHDLFEMMSYYYTTQIFKHLLNIMNIGMPELTKLYN